MRIQVRNPITPTALMNNYDPLIVWLGVLITVCGALGVAYAAFPKNQLPKVSSTEPPTSAEVRSTLPTLLLRVDNCNGCGLCAKKCVEEAITLLNTRPVHNPAQCNACMACVNICAGKAITLFQMASRGE